MNKAFDISRRRLLRYYVLRRSGCLGERMYFLNDI